MLRVAGRRISSSLSWRSAHSSPAFFSRYPVNASDSPSDHGLTRSVYSPHPYLLAQIKGFASDSLANARDTGKIPDIPAAVAAVKNPSSKFVYDDHNHERYPPGYPSKRGFATNVDISSPRDPHDDSARVNIMNIHRPLSPHLPIYKPQLTSTFSIFHRISGAFLSTMVLGSYFLGLKMGLICFTYENFYQFLFSSSKLILISIEITALALSYHLYHGIRHLLTDFSGFLFLGRKRLK